MIEHLGNRPPACAGSATSPPAARAAPAPYVELRDYLARRPEEREQALATLAYFDHVNPADGITFPILMGCATVDEVHPLRSALQAFQRVRGLKSIVVYPDLEHGPAGGLLRPRQGLAGSLPALHEQ